MPAPDLLWDWGTAYDLFISLEVLQRPASFGVPGAWAAGMRARLPALERAALEQRHALVHVPLHWIYTLPAPKDANAALWSLEQMQPEQRLPALSLSPDEPPAIAELLHGVAARRAWGPADLARLRTTLCDAGPSAGAGEPCRGEELAGILSQWAEPVEFGEAYLGALRAYHDAFFSEEERRIRPALQESLLRAQSLAGTLPLVDLLEELSQGVRFAEPPAVPELVLAPSYWCTPLIYMGQVSARRSIYLFGARPADASLVPGQAVPDALLRTLKALSDPTRLRILHDLAQEPLSPAQIARRLRLRAPTVTHHLTILRLAGLLQLRVEEAAEKRYAARSEAVAAAFESLKGFLDGPQPGRP
jgi:DNA-binding transcriptional ArsR family regulator